MVLDVAVGGRGPYVARIEPEMVVNLEEDYANWSESDENFLERAEEAVFEYIFAEDMSLRAVELRDGQGERRGGEIFAGE